jgi:predicted TIM-barrel fold metal-dependent hydrolase
MGQRPNHAAPACVPPGRKRAAAPGRTSGLCGVLRDVLRRGGIAAGLCLAALPAAAAEPSYTMADFARVEKIDAHVHLHGTAERFMAQAAQDGVRVLTINVDYPDFPPIDVQQRDAIALRGRYPERAAFAATFGVADFAAPGWAEKTRARLDDALDQGAVGVKVWKNIGMALRDPDGSYVMLDDARFKPLFDHLERRGVVLLGHQAEPLNCWLRFEKMTVRSDREYFREHPQYYMFDHPEMPSHAAQLAARDRVLAAHPALHFDGVHLASLEWDVDEVARFLDRFPLANVDLAARMVHLEAQASHDRDKVRGFLIRYQDRILYGTDIADGTGDGAADAAAAAEAHEAWQADWRFLNTAETLHSPDFDAPFSGLALPAAVVDKIYHGNARRMFPGAWSVPGRRGG